MKKGVLAGLTVIALLVSLMAGTVSAADPTVTITVTARVLAINNTQDTWAIGVIATSTNATWGNSPTYSMAENIGNVAVDIEIQGTDLTAATGTNWTLSADGDPGEDIYALNATTATEFTTVVKSSSYNDLTTDLAASANVTWSMRFWSPTSLTDDEDTVQKSATVTLVASEHT